MLDNRVYLRMILQSFASVHGVAQEPDGLPLKNHDF